MSIEVFLAEQESAYQERVASQLKRSQLAQAEASEKRKLLAAERILPYLPEILRPFVDCDNPSYEACLRLPGRVDIWIVSRHSGIEFYTCDGYQGDLTSALVKARIAFENPPTIIDEESPEPPEPALLLERIAIALERIANH